MTVPGIIITGLEHLSCLRTGLENGKAFALDGNETPSILTFKLQRIIPSRNFWIKDESSSNAYRRWLTTSNSGHVTWVSM